MAALSLAVGGGAWAEPCGGLKLGSGTVETAPLVPAAALTEADAACAKAVAAAFKGVGGLCSITVAVRMADAARSGGGGLAAAKAWSAALAAEGIPAARVFPVAPLLPAGEAPSVRFAFTESRPARPVAAVLTGLGDVKSGAKEEALQPAPVGTRLAPSDHVQTGAGAAARIAVADGSALVAKDGTPLRLGNVELNAQLKRSVRVDLVRGKMDVVASKGGEGSLFEVGTPLGLAGVRGASFRRR